MLGACHPEMLGEFTRVSQSQGSLPKDMVQSFLEALLPGSTLPLITNAEGAVRCVYIP